MVNLWLPCDSGTSFDGGNIRTGWLSTVINNAVLFKATLTYASEHLRLISGSHCPIAASSRRMLTIRGINDQIDDPEMTTSDSTIGAVAMLAAAEVSMSLNTIRHVDPIRSNMLE